MIKLSLEIQYGIYGSGLASSVLYNWVKKTLSISNKILKKSVKKAEFCLRLVKKQEIQALNRDFRHQDCPTNVLTFEYGTNSCGTISSDIVICIPILKIEAFRQKKLFLHHAAHLVVHGTLHALGYDHKKNLESYNMKNIETQTMMNLGMPDPYLRVI